jgi:hypothetical protein
MNTTNIYGLLKDEFPGIEMGDYCTDLHVVYSTNVYNFLKENYEYFNNVKLFTSDIDGSQWIEIPFAYPLENEIGYKPTNKSQLIKQVQNKRGKL